MDQWTMVNYEGQHHTSCIVFQPVSGTIPTNRAAGLYTEPGAANHHICSPAAEWRRLSASCSCSSSCWVSASASWNGELSRCLCLLTSDIRWVTAYRMAWLFPTSKVQGTRENGGWCVKMCQSKCRIDVHETCWSQHLLSKLPQRNGLSGMLWPMRISLSCFSNCRRGSLLSWFSSEVGNAPSRRTYKTYLKTT